ncbi:MAG TPA: hypothetical protein VGG05_07640 [Pseudonocardiaceae bacterium]|jgi:hypothetical protein
MKVNIIGTRVGGSTAPGAKEFWTFARTREVLVDRFVRAGMPDVVNSDIAELLCLFERISRIGKRRVLLPILAG